MKYLTGDQIEECREALRQGGKLDIIAAKLGVPSDELATLLDVRPLGSMPRNLPQFDRRPDIT